MTTNLAALAIAFVAIGIFMVQQYLRNPLDLPGNRHVNQWMRIETDPTVTPAPRVAHAACAIGDFMYMNGGFDGNNANPSVFPLDELFRYDELANQWQKLTTTGDVPSPRLHHSLTCLESTNELVAAFGFDTFGTKPHECLGDIYRLNLKTLVWRRVPNTVIPARGGHNAVALKTEDDAHQLLFAFGGTAIPTLNAGAQLFDDTYMMNLADESITRVEKQKTTMESEWPEARLGASMIVLANQSVHVTMGAIAGKTQTNSEFVFDPNSLTWQRVYCTHAPAPRRAANAEVVVGDLLFLWGGVQVDKKRVFDQMHVLDLRACRWLDWSPNYGRGAAPRATFGHTMVAVRDKVVAFGGRAGGSLTAAATNELWEFEFLPGI